MTERKGNPETDESGETELELQKETLKDLQPTERADVRGGACRQGASQRLSDDCQTAECSTS